MSCFLARVRLGREVDDVRAIYATTEGGSDACNSSSPKNPDDNEEDGVTSNGYQDGAISRVEEETQVSDSEEESEPGVEGKQVGSVSNTPIRSIVVLEGW